MSMEMMVVRLLTEMLHSGIALYAIYSLRVYLLARLEKFGPEQVFVHREEEQKEGVA